MEAYRWLVFPLVLFALSVALHARGTFDPLNNWLLDYRMEQTPVPSSGEIAVIAIDPQSLKEIGTWPWSRSVHADILDRLVEQGAGIVMYDVDFAFASDAAGDQAFADALERAGGATLLATFAQRALDGSLVFNQPYEPFNERSWPAVVTVSPDAQGQIRRYPTGAEIDGFFVPSAGVQLAGSFANETQGFTINYGISPKTVPVFSVRDLLDGTLTEDDIAGRSFLVGAVAVELGDHFAVPLHQVIPGVMVHAIAAETLIQDAVVWHASSIWLWPLLFIGLCALHLVGRKSAWRLISLAFLAMIGTEFAALSIFSTNYLNVPTAMMHPALVMLAIGRLGRTVDLSRIRIMRQRVQMENAERLRQHIFENSSDGFLAINSKGEIVFQSDVANSLIGSTALPEAIYRTARRVLKNPGFSSELEHLTIETPMGTKSIELHANASELKDLDNGQNIAREPLALITLRDVTEIKKRERQIEFLSRHDDKTSALRRHSFAESIQAHIEDNAEFAVVAIALRRLTSINATLGREIGDRIIAEAVQRLLDRSLGLGDVARIDGNVLGVIIPHATSEAKLEAVCQSIRDTLARPYSVANSQIQIGLSMGYLAYDPEQDWDAAGYLSRAEDALDTSIESPEFVICSYDPTLGERRERSRRLEHALNHAIERDELTLLYQPQYRLSDHSLIGAEALVRWQSAEFGNVSPAEFIPIAESSGFITELGAFVLEQSIMSAAQLPDYLVMSPNVSALQLLSADFPGQVVELLDKSGLAPERLCLELTESEYLSPDSEAVERMRTLRAMGVTWALDDFGTGYSSLSYLKDLPFQKIKLDRAFLKDILEDRTAEVTLRSLIQLAHGYGKTLLCEGVESEREVDLLKQLGCDSVQGYYFGRPETFDQLKSRAEISTRQPLSLSLSA